MSPGECATDSVIITTCWSRAHITNTDWGRRGKQTKYTAISVPHLIQSNRNQLSSSHRRLLWLGWREPEWISVSINVVVVAGLFCVSCSPSSGFILSPGSAPLIYLHYPNSQICGNKENNCENENDEDDSINESDDNFPRFLRLRRATSRWQAPPPPPQPPHRPTTAWTITEVITFVNLFYFTFCILDIV